MSIEEVARLTRVPVVSIRRIEADYFDELPGDVFVRGFLKAYARAVQLPDDEVLARYTASRRIAWVTPLPLTSTQRPARGGRFGVAIAFVLLLFLFALAVSIVLKPRTHEMPQELSRAGAPISLPTAAAAPKTHPSMAEAAFSTSPCSRPLPDRLARRLIGRGNQADCRSSAPQSLLA